ncbi:hypothetical protein BpHYR1_039219 [Brachionus plicatilis]|uniref:Uncharacterized protein n=1 Tax=Brachionus plicatilis TaxID=10195 RepID=A0A3M7QVZ8_BRAPC|nr:hypothetical protein BpHYR1_039219 [Brachionus plicatilis]
MLVPTSGYPYTFLPIKKSSHKLLWYNYYRFLLKPLIAEYSILYAEIVAIFSASIHFQGVVNGI